MTLLRKVLLGGGIAVALAAAAATAVIGPRNIIGMLRYDKRQEGTLRVGDTAPDAALVALDGRTREHLAQRLGGKPLVLVFGSFT